MPFAMFLNDENFTVSTSGLLTMVVGSSLWFIMQYHTVNGRKVNTVQWGLDKQFRKLAVTQTRGQNGLLNLR